MLPTPKPGELRLFVAVEFTPAAKRYLLSAMEKIRRVTVGGSFTPIENFHLTLAFIGETAKVDAAKAALSAVEFAPFSCTLGGGYGTFRAGEGKTLWLGMKEGSEPLAALADKVASALRKEGFRIESRPFSPHITLARRVQSVDLTPDPGSFPIRVERISLMRSDRDPRTGKMVYRPIAEQPAD